MEIKQKTLENTNVLFRINAIYQDLIVGNFQNAFAKSQNPVIFAFLFKNDESWQ